MKNLLSYKMALIKTIKLILFLFIIPVSSVYAGIADSISQWGVTWYFDKEYEYGQYANGDYWVLGPVVITEISPEFDGSWNGWQVNPLPNEDHGFKEGCYGGEHFNPELVPELPYNASPGSSIIKTIANGDDDRPCLKTAVVLTIVDEIPPDSGSAVFRPPYIGSDKPLYSIEDLRTELLPSFEKPGEIVNLEWVYNRFKRVQMDHLGGRMTQGLRPLDNMPNYGADIGTDEGEAAVRLMLNDPLDDKMPALIAFIQYGIDLHHMILLGHIWPPGGGEMPCHTLPWVFAAYMLDNEDMKEYINNYKSDFSLYNDLTVQQGHNNVILFGQTHHSYSENNYWQCVESISGNKTQADPYGFIDGGPVPGDYYQHCCTSQPWKTQIMAFHLMPGMKDLWWNQELADYVARWVESGTWTQPDPCAPLSQGGGPNPDKPGECILDPDLAPGSTFDDFECPGGADCGRFPDLHGTETDGGYRGSNFIDGMWELYYDVYKNDQPPVVNAPIPDISLDINDTGKTILLTDVFTDPDDYSDISLSIRNNDNESLVSAYIDYDTLFLNVLKEQAGIANIMIQAHSNGITVVDTFQVTVDNETLNITDKKPIPEDIFLGQNYPNPFHTKTTITFCLPEKADVKISIFNLDGECINTIIRKSQEAGCYSFHWNTKNLPPGIYFYKMESNGFTAVKKCILLNQ